jgi:hypothetical protein
VVVDDRVVGEVVVETQRRAAGAGADVEDAERPREAAPFGEVVEDVADRGVVVREVIRRVRQGGLGVVPDVDWNRPPPSGSVDTLVQPWP